MGFYGPERDVLMKNWNAWVLSSVAVAALTAVLFVAGCSSEEQAETPTTPVETVQVVNSICPMMGSLMDPTNVAVTLTRDFQGQKVGFCCGQCVPAWDKLADDKKAEKLQALLKP